MRSKARRKFVADLEAIEALGVCPVLGDHLYEDNVARHNFERVAKNLLEIAVRHPRKNLRHIAKLRFFSDG